MRKWLLLVLAFVPSIALACPVCGNAPEKSQAAYFMMTVVMSLLPLAALGGLFYLFVRRQRRADALADLARLMPPSSARPGGAPVVETRASIVPAADA